MRQYLSLIASRSRNTWSAECTLLVIILCLVHVVLNVWRSHYNPTSSPVHGEMQTVTSAITLSQVTSLNLRLTLLLLPIAIAVCIRAKQWTILTLGLVPAAIFLGLCVTGGTLPAFPARPAILWLTIAWMFSYFLIAGELFSLSAAIALALFPSFVFIVDPSAIALLYAGVPVLLVVTLAGVIRTLTMVTVQNVGVLHTIGLRRGLRVASKSLLLWLPILAFAVPAELYSRKIQKSVTDSLYNNKIIKRPDDDDGGLLHSRYDSLRPKTEAFDPTDGRMLRRIEDKKSPWFDSALAKIYKDQSGTRDRVEST